MEQKDDHLLLGLKFYLRGKGTDGLECHNWGEHHNLSKDESLTNVMLSSSKSQEAAAATAAVVMSDLITEMSPDGRLMLLVNRDIGWRILNTETNHSIVCQNDSNAGIQAVGFSPKSHFFVSWQRIATNKATDSSMNEDKNNLKVWNTMTGEMVASFAQKKYSKAKWPSVVWSSDEIIAARMVTNEVHLYNGLEIQNGIVSKIIQPSVCHFSVAPGPAPYHLATFLPEKKGRPASVKIFQFPNLETPTASKSFFKAQDVNMKWSPNGSALIIETSTDVDTSGKSYYGETGLYFLQSDGNFDCIITTTKEGPVHDVKWDPTGRGFIVVAGTMPCHSTLYDNHANPVFEFGSAPRNVCSFSPHGRFLAIAGFGNLAGDIDFWDRNKLVKIGFCNSNSSTTHGWSPDSRFFSTATCFPRLRVDNGFKIYKYNGEGPVAQEARTELYAMHWRPASSEVYPNRPQSPKSDKSVALNAAASAAAEKAKAKPQAYRPPGYNANFASMMRREDGDSKKLDRRAAPKSLSATMAAGPRVRVIPGMAPSEPLKTGISKNAKKKKNREDAAARMAVLKATEEALLSVKKIPAVAAPSTEAPVVQALTEEEKTKKLKGLNKKIKQIVQLKKKRDEDGIKSLNADQLEKLESESAIQEEISLLS